MRLPVVQKKKRSKKDQTLDTVASVAKAWGEWQLAKTAAKAAKKAPWKIVAVATAGAAAVGIGAKKLLGGGSSDAPDPASAARLHGPRPGPQRARRDEGRRRRRVPFRPGRPDRFVTVTGPRGPRNSRQVASL